MKDVPGQGGPLEVLARELQVGAGLLDVERPLSDLSARRRRDAQRRRLTVAGLRLLLGVVFLGTWELTTRLGWIDVFFWSQPTAIAPKLWILVTQGTDLGPLCAHVLVTIE